jgi:hypothetical protein
MNNHGNEEERFGLGAPDSAFPGRIGDHRHVLLLLFGNQRRGFRFPRFFWKLHGRELAVRPGLRAESVNAGWRKR